MTLLKIENETYGSILTSTSLIVTRYIVPCFVNPINPMQNFLVLFHTQSKEYYCI